ncbi:MAG: LysE family translocator [Pseudomonadota bacterium]
MPPWDLLAAFAVATAVFAYVPGPAMLYAAAQTLVGGRGRGFRAALGIHLGGYVHVIAAAFGLAAAFALVPVLFVVLKLVGAAYLVWLGIGMIVGKAQPQSTGDGAPPAALTQSAIVEILNPKTAIFYLAFLPQFTDPAAALPLAVQLLVLGTIVNVVFSSADVVVVLVTAAGRHAWQSWRGTATIARRLGGALLIGLGVRLALERS